ncbi:DUF445 family protein [Peptacetobacter hominis]|uniref:DUF445 family protein n=1 Tax=Peptacetobacter hominis TaxID=2743610 RepID=A0A544QVX5_9FIRM|nr:DUF445 family protein [Peptacetobacter hominis]TQQ84847.1 DUF445 family protein [Peptacetobacter hominis]
MEIFFRILLMALIGGLIGYITNVVAVKMLFRPIVPVKIPIINYEIMGLIPKRRAEIAKNIAQIVNRELLNEDDIFDGVIKEEDKEKIVEYLNEKIGNIVSEKAMFLPRAITGMINSYISDIVKKEASDMIDQMGDNFIKTAKERVDIEKIVEDKINAFDLEEIEKITLEVASRELKHIEVLGLILGFIIGIVQGIISFII